MANFLHELPGYDKVKDVDVRDRVFIRAPDSDCETAERVGYVVETNSVGVFFHVDKHDQLLFIPWTSVHTIAINTLE